VAFHVVYREDFRRVGGFEDFRLYLLLKEMGERSG